MVLQSRLAARRVCTVARAASAARRTGPAGAAAVRSAGHHHRSRRFLSSWAAAKAATGERSITRSAFAAAGAVGLVAATAAAADAAAVEPAAAPEAGAAVEPGEGATDAAGAGGSRPISLEELAAHNTEESCWLAIKGNVYDITTFLPSHPGGKGAVLSAAGTDGTTQFVAFHSKHVLPNVGEKYRIGSLSSAPSATTAAKDGVGAGASAGAGAGAGAAGTAAPARSLLGAAASAATEDKEPPTVEPTQSSSPSPSPSSTRAAATPTAAPSTAASAATPNGDDGDDEYVDDRISAVIDGSKDAGSGSHVQTYCTAAELRALPSVAAIAAEATKRGAPALISGYVNYGTEDEESIANNRGGFERYRLRTRILRDVRDVRTKTTILGGRITCSAPILVAPFAGGKGVHKDGELGVARAAAKADVAYAVPHYGGFPLTEVAAAAAEAAASNKSRGPGNGGGGGGGANLMVQLYVPKRLDSDGGDGGVDKVYLRKAIKHAGECGVKAVFITVDTMNNGNREKTYKNPQWIAAMVEQCGGFPEVRTFEEAGVGSTAGHTQRMTWEDILWMKQECRKAGDMAIIVKGVMSPEDTDIAASLGIDGVVISNHGGRQLDGTDGPIELVKECVDAAAGRCDVFMDGGVRRGKDVYKALALGATAVLIGRPVLWGMSIAGEKGVARTLELLKEELVTVMQLCGAVDSNNIDPRSVRDREA